tara:strand:- start:313 stop:789 length:477 start_codon:yes stop_codon:yes gene_type:complete
MADAVYPGSFDPVHNGHVDIARRASKLFDHLVIAVYDSPSKDILFSTEERIELFNESIADLPNVKVVAFSGLVPNLAKEYGAQFILRGLRAGFDFELEFEMALMWRSLDQDVDVLCMMSSLQYQFVYSSRIKEVVRLDGDISGLVPANVYTALKEKFS